jgi:hypothetical protein
VAFALSLGLVACDGKQAEPAQAPAETHAAQPKKAEPTEKGPPPASIDEPTFKLVLEAEPNYAAEQEGKFRVVLTAQGGYHVNQDYPIRVDLKGPDGLKLPKPSLGKPDATEFGEQKARFDVAFSAPKGAHGIEAKVDFAVCTEETCVPDERTLALSLKVD